MGFEQIEEKFREDMFELEVKEFADDKFPGKRVVMLDRQRGIGSEEAKHIIKQENLRPDYKHSYIQPNDWMDFKKTVSETCDEDVVCVYPHDHAFPEWDEIELKREDLKGKPIERLYWKDPWGRFQDFFGEMKFFHSDLHNSYEAPIGNIDEIMNWARTADPSKINRTDVSERINYDKRKNWNKEPGPPIVPQRATISQVKEVYKATKELTRYRRAILFTKR